MGSSVWSVSNDTNASVLSAENSNDETNGTAAMASRLNFSNTNNEDSNGAAFSEVEFGNSDSNQTETFDRVDYKREEGIGGVQTDFSQLVREEAADRINGQPSPASRKRRANNGNEDEPSVTRKRSK
uniref:Uncharacterized protein n=1 Tax=Ditylenchus dipsaci TaxID=166011 RepID=A0A915E1N5_9BILA